MKLDRRFRAFLSLLCASCIAVALNIPPPSSAAELTDLVEEALEHNPSLEAARISIEEAESAIDQARSSLWPTANATASYSRPSYIPEAKFGPGQTLKFGTPNQINSELRATYPFFTWGAREASIRISRLNAENSRDAYEQVTRALTLSIARVYFGISLAHEALSWARQNADLVRSQRDLVADKYKAGSASNFDVTRMEVELAAAESEVVTRSNQLERLNVALNRLLGRKLAAPVQSDTLLPKQPPGEADTLAPLTAAERHVDLKMLRRGYAVYEQKRALTKAQWLRPMPAAFFSYVARNGQFPNVEQIRGSWSVGVSLSLPLFDGFLTERKLQQIEIQKKKLKAQEMEKEREIAQQILNARNDLTEAVQQIIIGRKRYNQALESYNIARTVYASGGLGSMDLIESQRALKGARLTLLGYQYDAVVKWCAMRDAEYLPYVEAFTR